MTSLCPPLYCLGYDDSITRVMSTVYTHFQLHFGFAILSACTGWPTWERGRVGRCVWCVYSLLQLCLAVLTGGPYLLPEVSENANGHVLLDGREIKLKHHIVQTWESLGENRQWQSASPSLQTPLVSSSHTAVDWRWEFLDWFIAR